MLHGCKGSVGIVLMREVRLAPMSQLGRRKYFLIMEWNGGHKGVRVGKNEN